MTVRHQVVKLLLRAQTGSESGAGSMRSEDLETSRSSDLTTRASVPTVSAQAAEVTSEATAVAKTAVVASIEAEEASAAISQAYKSHCLLKLELI